MKRLLILLVLLSGSAKAEQWLEAGNQDGGRILLLQSKCSNKSGETGRLVITNTSSGRNLTGCWYYFADMVHVVWADGTSYSYNKEIFTYKESQ